MYGALRYVGWVYLALIWVRDWRKRRRPRPLLSVGLLPDFEAAWRARQLCERWGLVRPRCTLLGGTLDADQQRTVGEAFGYWELGPRFERSYGPEGADLMPMIRRAE